MKAKMNSYIFNQLQLVSYSYLNHVVVNCFPISFLDGFNFLVLKALLKTVITTLNLFIQTNFLQPTNLVIHKFLLKRDHI